MFISGVLIGTLTHLVRMYEAYKFRCFTEDVWTTVLFVLIVIHLPIVVFQVRD